MNNNPIDTVVIGLCTCKRPKMLRACLDSLAAQILPYGIRLEIVVADNEPEPNARAGVEAFAATCPFPVHYAHQPKRGIAAARNAILDKAVMLNADWIAMLDDDETADVRWIADLMVEEYRHIPALMGRRIWTYPENRPFWAPEKEPKLGAEGAPARNYSTSNVRFSVAVPRAGVRFDEGMGLGGGEDQRFFSDAVASGFKIHITNRAITYETVHPERLTYRFMIWRDYAHTASVTSHKIRAGRRRDVLAALPVQLLNIPRGCLELAISPLALAFGRYRFKQFAMRGGKRLACAAGMVVATVGHLPQPYRHVVGS